MSRPLSMLDPMEGLSTLRDGVIEFSGKAVSDEIASVYKASLRVENLVLLSPRQGATQSKSTYPRHNIVLHRPAIANGSVKEPDTMFSLLRSASEGEATRIFHVYSQIFPDLVKASSSPLDKSALWSILKIAKQYESYSGVHVAAALGMVASLKSPIFRGKLIKPAGKLLQTPLQVACVHGKFEAFQAILEMGNERMLEDITNHVDFEGNSVVHLAAACKDREVGVKMLKLIKKLIGEYKGEEVLLNVFEKQNSLGLVPLHLACICQNLEAVVELTSVSDNPKEAASSNLVDIRASTGNTSLHFVTTNPRILSRLLSLGANPNIADYDGLTPLHKAVLMRQLRSTLKLLGSNADPNCKATSERYMNVTPLHLASGICDVDAMKALLVFGANTNVKDRNGNTPQTIVELGFVGEPTLKQEALSILKVDSKYLEENKEMIKEMYRTVISN